MNFTDTLTLDGVKRTADGYLAASVRVARTGIQLYTGDQVDRPDMEIVRVYRPEEEVFSDVAMRSYAHRPVTVDHPSEPVSATNWKDLAVGQTGDEVMRDGETVRVPMVLMDAAAINAVDAGKRELSMGYMAEIDWTDGVTPDGEPYDAIQRNLRMNHLAIVAKARGGSKLKIGDDNPKGDSAMTDFTKLVLDGITVNVPSSDAANVKAIFDAKDKEIAGATASLSDAQTKLADMTEKKEEADGKVAALEKELEDAKISPEKLTKLVADRSALIEDAKRVLGDIKDVETLDAPAIKRAVVKKVLGDAATDMSDAEITGAYSVAIKSTGNSGDPVAGLLKDGGGLAVIDGGADDARKKMLADRANAWKGGAA